MFVFVVVSEVCVEVTSSIYLFLCSVGIFKYEGGELRIQWRHFISFLYYVEINKVKGRVL